MKKVSKLVIPTVVLAFGLSLGLNMFLLHSDGGQALAGRLSLRSRSEVGLVGEALLYIKDQFVERNKVDSEKLLHGAVVGMLKELDDPYTRFMPPKAFEEMQVETRGKFGGLGIIIGMREGRVVVIAPLINTPAYRVGVEAGDAIMKVDGEPTKGKTLQDVVDVLRGIVGTDVHISVYREGQKKLLEFDITREEIKIPNVYARMLDDGVGYIYLSQFIQTSAPEISRQVKRFLELGLKGLVFDLRHNPGGLLEAAVQVGRLFLDKGIIVSVKTGKGKETKYPSFGAQLPPIPLVVLIDGGSASASEIFSGAVKDTGRGILVGKKSFGKGSVQTVLTLSDRSAIALTTAYYYTPAGTLIHNKGIEPDIEVDLPQLTLEEARELREVRSRFLEGALTEMAGGDDDKENGDDQEEDFSLLFKYDTQLTRAMDIIRSRELFESRFGEGAAGSGK